MNTEATERQKEFLKYIKEHSYFRIPPYRELAEHFGIRVRAAYDHVQALVKKGYLKKTKSKIEIV